MIEALRAALDTWYRPPLTAADNSAIRALRDAESWFSAEEALDTDVLSRLAELSAARLPARVEPLPTDTVCAVSEALDIDESRCSLIQVASLPASSSIRPVLQMRQVFHSPVRQSPLQAAQRALVDLAGPTLVHAQNLADLPQRHLTRIAKPNHSAVLGWQPIDLLDDHLRPLAVHNPVLRGTVRGSRNSRLPVRAAIRVRRQGRAQPLASHVATHHIQHLAPNPEFRVPGQGRAPARLIAPSRLQQPYLARLHQIRHFYSAFIG